MHAHSRTIHTHSPTHQYKHISIHKSSYLVPFYVQAIRGTCIQLVPIYNNTFSRTFNFAPLDINTFTQLAWPLLAVGKTKQVESLRFERWQNVEHLCS